MTEIQPELFVTVITFLITISGFVGVLAKWKVKLSAVRNLIDAVDDAVADNTVTEPEFQKIWSSIKSVISKT